MTKNNEPTPEQKVRSFAEETRKQMDNLMVEIEYCFRNIRTAFIEIEKEMKNDKSKFN